jgi:YVTN family beta-propeller protein
MGLKLCIVWICLSLALRFAAADESINALHSASISTKRTDPLRLVETIPLPGVEGRIDHMAIDADGQRLFIAALGNNSLEVVDLSTRMVKRSIHGLHEPQGVAFLKDRGLVVVASGDDGNCRFFDAKSFDALQSIDFHADADNLRYDATGQRLYVGFGGGALGVIDPKERKRIANIKLPSHPESFQLEANGNRIFVNLPKSRQIAVVDRKKAAIVDTWPLTTAQDNFPMALDEVNQRLFVGCRAPAKILIYNTNTGKVLAHFPTVGDTDDLFYDNKTQRLYVAGGEGFIIVHQKKDSDRYSQLARIPTAPGARTALFVPALSRLYLAVPHRDSQAAELRVFEVVR